MKIEFDVENRLDRRRVRSLLVEYDREDGVAQSANPSLASPPVTVERDEEAERLLAPAPRSPTGTELIRAGVVLSKSDIALQRLKRSRTGSTFLVPLAQKFNPGDTKNVAEIASGLNTRASAVASYIRILGKYFKEHSELSANEVLITNNTNPVTYTVSATLKDRLAKL